MRLKFQSIVTTAFLTVLLVSSVSLAGFAIHYGHQSIEGTIALLRASISANIIKQLDAYLEVPANIVRTNIENTDQLADLGKIQDIFWIQQMASLRVSAIFAGTARREFIGVERRPDGALYKTFADRRSAYAFKTYKADQRGRLKSLVAQQAEYDPRVRPWYVVALQQGHQVWSSAYPFALHKTLYLANSAPIFNAQGETEGVIAAALNLDQVSVYLRRLTVGAHGKILIIDTQGQLIATSTDEPLIQTVAGESRQCRADSSPDPTIRALVKHLAADFGPLNSIKRVVDLSVNEGGTTNYLRVTPYRLSPEVRWLILVDLSKQDFMSPINALTRHLIIVCILSLILALILGLSLSRWISQPIASLTASLKRFAAGDLETKVSLDRSDEIGQMAAGFNSMAAKIKENFETIENKVEERTKALSEANLDLQASENRFRSLADAAFEGICITEQGTILEVNSAMAKMFGYSIHELIGMRPTDLVSADWREDVSTKMLSYYDKPYEVVGLNKDGHTFPVEVHAKMFSYQGRPVRVAAIRDLSEQRKVEQELKELRGILPLCSYCKRIRDDKGDWQQLDTYISIHSQADLSHGICPECFRKYYQEFAESDVKDDKK